jgi:hypothetical protein
LDDFDVPGRLRHVHDYVWRGGTLGFQVEDQLADTPPNVYYELCAHWDAAVLEPLDGRSGPGLQRAATPVVEGRWIRGSAGYQLRVGIDLAIPSAIYIRTDRILSCVPFVQRSRAEVEHALAADLAAYVDWFLSACATVPAAAESARQTLQRLDLS